MEYLFLKNLFNILSPRMFISMGCIAPAVFATNAQVVNM